MSQPDPSPCQPGLAEFWLERWNAAGELDSEGLTAHVYSELRRLANRFLAAERPNHTLQATALVHEVFIQMQRTPDYSWKSRGQIVAVAARMMRRILVDHARRFRAAKRGLGRNVPLEAARLAASPQDPDLIVLDEALHRFAIEYPRQAQVVELRFFGGLTSEETVEVLGAAGQEVSLRTVERDWRFARAWLEQALGAGT